MSGLDLKDIKLYQCVDSDGKSSGIIATIIENDKMDELADQWWAKLDGLAEVDKDPTPMLMDLQSI